MSKIKLNENTIFRRYQREMFNDYVKIAEVIDVDAWIRDAVVCPYLAEEMISDEFFEYYDDDNYVNIVKAFDKTWVFINQYGDAVTSVHVNKDGTVYGSSYGVPSPDLQDGMYYAGDEISYMGKVSPYDSDQSWLWSSVEVNCEQKHYAISKESMQRFIEARIEYLKEQAKEV